MPSHFEQFSSRFVERKKPSIGFSKNQLKKSMRRMISINQRLRTSIDEIQRGFRKQYNYRLIYECLKVYNRMPTTSFHTHADKQNVRMKRLRSCKPNRLRFTQNHFFLHVFVEFLTQCCWFKAFLLVWLSRKIIIFKNLFFFFWHLIGIPFEANDL